MEVEIKFHRRFFLLARKVRPELERDLQKRLGGGHAEGRRFVVEVAGQKGLSELRREVRAMIPLGVGVKISATE